MTDAIRVAMIIQGYHPRIGGAERQVAAVTPFLQARGVNVHILTRRYSGLQPYELINNVPVHRLPIPGPKAVASLTFTLAALPLLARLRPDVIHAHELFSPTTTAVAAKQIFKTPVVATLHRSGPLGDVQRLHAKTAGARRMATFRRAVDKFITISQEIDQELAGVQVPPERRVYIPNAVDTEHFAPLPPEARRALKIKLGLPPGPIAIFTGRLAPEKRVNHLVTVWPEIRAAWPDAHLLILGVGPEEAALKSAAGAGVQFAGSIEDVAPYLQAAEIFVLPSSAEGLSVAMLEAMATGTPALVTAVGGAGDVIVSGQNGWLIPPDDVPALRAALLKLLAEPALRAELGQRGRERVLRDYALPVIADRLRALYDQVRR